MRGVFANSNISQRDLIAWLDAQEQKLFLRVAPRDETVEAFDPLHREPEVAPAPRERDFDELTLPERIVDLYAVAERGEQGRGWRRRRTIKWRFDKRLTKPLVKQMLHRRRYSVRTRHKVNLWYAYMLRNIETNEYMVYYTNTSSPWFSKLSQTKAWLQEQEELRLQGEKINRPNTKWVFESTVFVDLKVILERQPLQIGLGRLPDWLRNKREVISLDTYNDDFCIFQCIAVHQGAHIQDNIRRTRELARSFFGGNPKPRGNVIPLKHFPLLERNFKQGIAAYTVTNDGDFVLSYTPSRYDKVSHPTMTVGIYEAHAFLITDIKKVTNNFTCGECLARFTRSDDLPRHIKTCTRGRTNISCPGNRILAPESAFEKAFYPEANFGIKATCWLEYEAQQRGIHIHHHRCGHGGERTVAGDKVDGYHPESKTVFQYHGCFWHGCLECSPRPEQRNEVLWIDRKGNEITREAAYKRTLKRSEVIRFLGYNLVERWEHERPRPWWHARLPPKRNETYPHAIVYDFEAYQNKTKASNPTRDLSYESEQVPISVSIADTLNTEPQYICSKDPEELISLFYQSFVQRSALIRADVEERYMPPDLEGLSEDQQNLIKQWCAQVPVVGFNSGRYDLNLIRKYFITHLGQENGVLSGEKQGRIIYINTPHFKFLDITNYLSPGISYNKWVKMYGANQAKSWLPYECFDSADKLDYKAFLHTGVGIQNYETALL